MTKEISNYQEVIDYLNLKAGRRYRVTPKHQKHINARFNEGYQIGAFKQVVDNMVREWANDPKMYKYLRPETLFGTKFDGYLNQVPAPAKKHPSGIQPAQSLDQEAMKAKIEEQYQFAKEVVEDGEAVDRKWLTMAFGRYLMEYFAIYEPHGEPLDGDHGLDPKYEQWYQKTWEGLEVESDG